MSELQLETQLAAAALEMLKPAVALVGTDVVLVFTCLRSAAPFVLMCSEVLALMQVTVCGQHSEAAQAVMPVTHGGSCRKL